MSLRVRPCKQVISDVGGDATHTSISLTSSRLLLELVPLRVAAVGSGMNVFRAVQLSDLTVCLDAKQEGPSGRVLYSEPLLRRTNVSAKVQLSLATLACSIQAQVGRVGCGVSAQQMCIVMGMMAQASALLAAQQASRCSRSGGVDAAGLAFSASS